MNIQLVVIDPQNSFCKVVDPAKQQVDHDGELCVPNAWEDMLRVTELVKRLGDKLDDIKVTLDSHHYLHIAHPMWFRSTSGAKPPPFTRMTVNQGNIVGASFNPNTNNWDTIGEFTTVRPSFLRRTLDYLRTLEKNKRYPHLIWPPHCLIGTMGHNVVQPLMDALLEWEQKSTGFVDKVTKGSNIWVEHFSAVRAEVPDPDDPSTQLNTDFINTLMEADEVLLAGEARSHCLANTVRDIANEFTADGDKFVKKCVLLTDATSDVAGFAQYGEDFVKEMTGRGMRTTTCGDYLN